ncbi:MAG: cysteine desulfurase NifS [Elusimicrobia bacterium RIFOXYA2_FULL_40_6]|nr:MAG: cysteine desulfurase NifS [Elusimicrobia bacterium RIFOXYA2_FULL_40_6]
MTEIYLDNHSNTKLDERVLNEMLPYLKENYGNAQSMHSIGAKSKDALDIARKQVADLIGSKENEIYFTSCASEANNLAIKGAAEAYKQKNPKGNIIVSGIEHFSVLYSAKRLEQAGFTVTYLPVDKYGTVSPEDVKNAIKPDTILVSIQHANPEIGTIQDIEVISKIVHEKEILFHTDAVCTAGTVPVDVNKLGVDLLTLSGTQFYGPKGAAALYIKKGIRVIPQIDGGIQENGRRAGTENIPAIVGMGKAAEIAKNEMAQNYNKLISLRDKLISQLPKNIEYSYLNGHPAGRLPNNVNFSIEFIEGEGMLLFLDQKGIYVTSGSACTSKALKMSHVLAATKMDTAVAQGSVLMTLSKYITAENIDFILKEFPPIVKRLRDMSPLYAFFQKTGKRQEAGPGTDYEHEHEEE